MYLMFQLTPSSLEGAPKLEPSNASRQIEDSLEGYLDKFNNSDNWRFFSEGFSRDEFQERASVLHAMHHQATVKQQAIEEEELIQQPLDKKQLDDFVAEVHEHWADAATLRSLFTKYGNYDPRPDVKPPDGLLPFGMQHIEPKGAFVRNSRVHYLNWGQNHGRGLARGEDRMLTGDLLGLPGVDVELDKLTISLKQHLDELRSTGYAPIILYGGWEIRKKIFAASEFEPSWRIQQPPDLKHADGTFDGALILQFSDAPKGVAILVDIARFGRLVQYRIDESADFPLFIAIQEITLDTAASLLDKQPELAKHPQTGVMLNREDAIRRLQQRVLVNIWERCRFEDKDLASGKVLHVSELTDHATVDTESHEILKDTLPVEVRTSKRKQRLRRRKKASKRSKGGDTNRGRSSSDDD